MFTGLEECKKYTEEQLKEYLKDNKHDLKSQNYTEKEAKIIFFCNTMLEFSTYCDAYSLHYGKLFIDILEDIFNRKTLKHDDEYCKLFLIAYNTMKEFLDYGTTIYSCWIDYDQFIEFGYNEYREIKLSKEYVEWLIKYIKGE